MDKYVIQYRRDGLTRFVRVYKNGKTYVDRLHGETATNFTSVEEAQAIINKFGLPNAEVVIQ